MALVIRIPDKHDEFGEQLTEYQELALRPDQHLSRSDLADLIKADDVVAMPLDSQRLFVFDRNSKRVINLVASYLADHEIRGDVVLIANSETTMYPPD